MSHGLKRFACAAAVMAVVAGCDPSLPQGLMPQARVGDGGTTIAGQVIAFASNRNADLFQTFVMKANGTKVTQLTYQPFYNARPDWSRDGSRITFTPCPPAHARSAIYLINPHDSPQTTLTPT